MSELRALLLRLRTPQGLLEDRRTRTLLIDLLHRSEADELRFQLSVEGGSDSFDVLRSMQIRPGSDRLLQLLAFFQLPYVATMPEEKAPAETEIAVGYGLFDHQRVALRDLRQALSQSPHRAVLHMPTGSGKTRTAMNLVAEHLREREPTLAFWFATTEELCDQADDEFTRAWKAIGNRPLKVYRAWGGRDFDPRSATDGLVIASLATAHRRQINTGTWAAWAGDKTSLIVMDEAHQAIAPTYRLVLDTFKARRPDSRLVGLTATPGRTWNDMTADEELADYFARQKVSLQVSGYPNPVEYLISEGYLARPSFVPLLHHCARLTQADQRALAQDLDVPESILEKLADDEMRNLRIAVEVERLGARHRRILVFATTVDHAELLAAVLQARGLAARSVTSRSSHADRTESIAWYRAVQDETRVLTNFGVLTTGFDAPKTSAALIARPTKSLVLFSQMVGRATRGTRAGGNAAAEIVTVVDTSLQGFGDMSQAFTNWEDVW